MNELQRKVKEGLPGIVEAVNQYLCGDKHPRIKRHLCAIEPGNEQPSWFIHLARKRRPQRTDGKSLGTYIEKLLKAEMSRLLGIPLIGSSASGVDIPELDLNTKATSDRQPQSSEPFDSAYDRVLGAKFDIVVCIYNGRELLESSCPLRILSAEYLKKTEVADAKLCGTAKLLQRLALAKVIGNDLAKRTLKSIVHSKKAGPKGAFYMALHDALASDDPGRIAAALESCEQEMGAEGQTGVPSSGEWNSFLRSPLEGKIGISFALQWRYQFRSLAK